MSGVGVEKPNVYTVVRARCPKCGKERVTTKPADRYGGQRSRQKAKLVRLSPCCQVDEEREVWATECPEGALAVEDE